MDELEGLDRQALDTQALCVLVSERHHALVDLEYELLELAALWADHCSTLPDSDADDPFVVAGRRSGRRSGATGEYPR